MKCRHHFTVVKCCQQSQNPNFLCHLGSVLFTSGAIRQKQKKICKRLHLSNVDYVQICIALLRKSLDSVLKTLNSPF